MAKPVIVCVLAVLLVAVLTPSNALTLTRIPRDVAKTTDLPICPDSTPCGWAVYTPFTRQVDYFVKNTMCMCKDSTKCIRASDDLSVSAYVYQCLPIENSNTPSPTS